jgi:hypothetical protein
VSITESEVREAALRALARTSSGFISTENLISILQKDLKPTGEDLEILQGRSDTRFSQKVRNLVSHRDASTSLERHGLATYVDNLEGWQITDMGRTYVDTQNP